MLPGALSLPCETTATPLPCPNLRRQQTHLPDYHLCCLAVSIFKLFVCQRTWGYPPDPWRPPKQRHSLSGKSSPDRKSLFARAAITPCFVSNAPLVASSATVLPQNKQKHYRRLKWRNHHVMIDNHFLQKASITPGFVSACRTLVVRNWSGTIGRDAGTGWRDWSPHSFQTRHRSVQHRLPDGRHLPVNNLSFDRRWVLSRTNMSKWTSKKYLERL